jgi:hypothetical protein
VVKSGAAISINSILLAELLSTAVEHASHVTMSVTKLLSRIVAPSERDVACGKKVDSESLHDHTYGKVFISFHKPFMFNDLLILFLVVHFNRDYELSLDSVRSGSLRYHSRFRSPRCSKRPACKGKDGVMRQVQERERSRAE